MLAEARSGAGRLARAGREIERQARHRVAADTGLVDLGEEWVLRRAARVVAHEFDKILERSPEDAAAVKGVADLGQSPLRAPARQQRRYRVARLVAAGFGIEIDFHHLADHRQSV